MEPRRGGAQKGWSPEGVEPRRGGGPEGVEAPKGGGPNLEKVGPRRVVPRRVEAPKGGGPELGGPNLEKVGPRRVEPEGWSPEGWGPKFRAFFPSSRHNFLSSSSLLGSLRGILVVFFKRRGPEMCTFGVLGLSCESTGGPVWWGRRGFTRQPDSPDVHISGFRPSKKHHQNSTKGPQERGRRMKIVAGGGKKKERNVGRSGGWLSGGRLSSGGLSSGGGFTAGGGPAEGSIGYGVQGSGFRVQFRFFGTKTETEQKQSEERDEQEPRKK